jgi:HAD superfamily hydrolase (TIGR01509 family)
MNRPELIIFDMDGLMFDTEQIAFQTWRQAAANAGYKIDLELFKRILGVKIQRTEEIFMEHFGPQFSFDEIMRERYQLTDEWIERQGVPLKTGLVDLLAYLTRLNIKKAVATSTDRDKAETLIKKARIFDYFDYIICGSDVTHSKPNPEIFLKAAEKLGCHPANCMVLEDSNLGIMAASRAKMTPVMIPDLADPDAESKKLIFAQFNTLSDFQAYLEKTIK